MLERKTKSSSKTQKTSGITPNGIFNLALQALPELFSATA